MSRCHLLLALLLGAGPLLAGEPPAGRQGLRGDHADDADELPDDGGEAADDGGEAADDDGEAAGALDATADGPGETDDLEAVPAEPGEADELDEAADDDPDEVADDDPDEAADDAAAGPDEPLADRCLHLLGDGRTIERNRARREKLLVNVDDEEDTVWLMHQTSWSDPKHLVVEGLELVETARGPDGEWLAYLEVDEELAEEMDCDPGLQEVAIDDGLGAEGRVLAVLRDLVLVEVAGKLAFLFSPEREDVPDFRLVWRSSWKIIYHGDSGTTKRKSKKKSRRRRKKKRRR